MNNVKNHIAQNYSDIAFKFRITGKFDEAIAYYKRAAEINPTPEAFTYIGLAYSLKGEYEKAIDECYKAIDLDEEYESAYRDVGKYLINLKRYKIAVQWLRLATEMPKTESTFLSYFHLGIAYEKAGEWFEAVYAYNACLILNPEYTPAAEASLNLITLLN